MKTEFKSFYVNGFRNICKATLELNNVTAIVGLNSYGKSNLVNAIDMALRFIKAVPGEKDNIMGTVKNFPLLKINAGEDFTFVMTAVLTDDSGKASKIEYGFTFAWATIENIDNDKRRIAEEHLIINGTQYIRRSDNTAFYKSSASGRCDRPASIDDNQLLLNKLSNFDNLFYIDIIKTLNEPAFNIERHMDAADSFKSKRIASKNVNAMFSMDDIPRTAWNLFQHDNEKLSDMIDAFKQLFPSIENVKISARSVPSDDDETENTIELYKDRVYFLSVVDRCITQPVRFESLSDGTKRVFLTLTAAVLADILGLSVIVFEEPENSIHPSLLQSYLRILDQLSGDCKIIFTSHSPYMIQYLDPECIYIGIPCQTGETDFRRIKNSGKLIRAAEKYDQSTGDFIFESLSFANAADMLEPYLTKSALDLPAADDSDDDWLND